MPFELSQRQQSAVAAAVTILAALVILCALGGVFWLLGLFLQRFSHVFLPLAVAAVAALVFKPYYEWLHERLRLHPVLAVAAVMLSGLIPLVAFFWFFGAKLSEQAGGLLAQVPQWWTQATDFARERWPQVAAFLQEHEVYQRLRAMLEGQGDSAVQALQSMGGTALSLGGAIFRGLGTLFSWAVLPVYFAFFLIADPRVFEEPERHLPFLKPETRRDVVYLVGEFINILVAFFRGQLLVALAQGLLFAIGFTLVGLKYGFVLGLVLGFLNIIPYLGSIVGLAATMPLAFFQEGGGLLTLGLVLGVFTVVQMIEGYLLTPKIMGDRTGLHPMAIILAVFFWGSALGGITGMILAIPLTAFLVVFWRLAREKYISEIV